MKKAIIIAFLFFIGFGFADAYTTQTTYNPFTSNFDYILKSIENFTIENLVVDSIAGTDIGIEGNVLIWGNLTVYDYITSVNLTFVNANGSIIPAFTDVFYLGNSSNEWLDIYSKDIHTTNDLDVGNNLAVGGNITITDVADILNLKANNLEQNLDGTGYNITVYELTATVVDTTNLEADNLESNLDGTGYKLTIGDIVGATDVNGTNLHITNLYATNLEENLNGAGFYITAEGFVGKLNWTNLQNYPSPCAEGFAVIGVGDTLTCVNITNSTYYSGFYVNLTGDTMSGSLAMGNNDITGVGTLETDTLKITNPAYDSSQYLEITYENTTNVTRISSGNGPIIHGPYSPVYATGDNDLAVGGIVEVENVIMGLEGVETTKINATSDSTFQSDLYVDKDIIMDGGNITETDCILFRSGGKICDSP